MTASVATVPTSVDRGSTHALLGAVAVLRARVWTGWRRWTPLACGLALPFAFLAVAVAGRGAMPAAFGIATAAAFLALGVSVVTTRPVR